MGGGYHSDTLHASFPRIGVGRYPYMRQASFTGRDGGVGVGSKGTTVTYHRYPSR